MADPSLSLSLSLSALIAPWFTPSSLFIFLNLIIGTIAISSRFGAPKRQINDSHDAPQLVRSPSLLERVRSFRLTHDPPTVVQTECTLQPQLVRTPSLLERVRSFNFGIYRDEQPHAETECAQPNHPEPEIPPQPQLTRAPSLLQRLQSMNFSRLYKSDSIHGEEKPEHEPKTEFSESEADPGRGSGSEGGNVVGMRKSASERRGSERREWEEEEGAVERRRPMTARSETTSFRADEEVDARADDFINRFKRQLRLQRVDSIIRYKEMLRGN